MSDREFQARLGVTRSDFAEMAPWKQRQFKQMGEGQYSVEELLQAPSTAALPTTSGHELHEELLTTMSSASPKWAEKMGYMPLKRHLLASSNEAVVAATRAAVNDKDLCRIVSDFAVAPPAELRAMAEAEQAAAAEKAAIDAAYSSPPPLDLSAPQTWFDALRARVEDEMMEIHLGAVSLEPAEQAAAREHAAAACDHLWIEGGGAHRGWAQGLQKMGFERPLAAVGRAISAEEATESVANLLHKTMAYSTEVLGRPEAEAWAAAFTCSATTTEPVFFTAGRGDEGGPFDSTFDDGVVAVFGPDARGGQERGAMMACIWVEDED